MRISFKMVKDGDRTVIVVEGAAAERDAAVFQILQTYCELEVSPAPVIHQVECLESIQNEVDNIPSNEEINNMKTYADIYASGNIISDGIYKGITAAQALAKDKSKALAALFNYARYIPSSAEKDDIVINCKQFMYDAPSTYNLYPTRESKIEYLQNIATLMELSVFINGYQDFSSFCEFATDAEIDICFNQTLKTLQDRALKKRG